MTWSDSSDEDSEDTGIPNQRLQELQEQVAVLQEQLAADQKNGWRLEKIVVNQAEELITLKQQLQKQAATIDENLRIIRAHWQQINQLREQLQAVSAHNQDLRLRFGLETPPPPQEESTAPPPPPPPEESTAPPAADAGAPVQGTTKWL